MLLHANVVACLFRLRLCWDRVLDPAAQHVQLDKRVRGAQANVDLSHLASPSPSLKRGEGGADSGQDSGDKVSCSQQTQMCAVFSNLGVVSAGWVLSSQYWHLNRSWHALHLFICERACRLPQMQKQCFIFHTLQIPEQYMCILPCIAKSDARGRHERGGRQACG